MFHGNRTDKREIYSYGSETYSSYCACVAGLMFLVYDLISFMSFQKSPDTTAFGAENKSCAFSQIKTQITVDVEGVVENPGVYKLSSDERAQMV